MVVLGEVLVLIIVLLGCFHDVDLLWLVICLSELLLDIVLVSDSFILNCVGVVLCFTCLCMLIYLCVFLF